MQHCIKAVLLLFVTCFTCKINAQNSYTPQLGDTLPEYTFTDLRNYSSDQVSLSSLRGKWLVIDFWSKDCSGCLKSFPKMNNLHQKFKDQITFLMVGIVGDIKFESSGKTIKREQPTKLLYDRLEKLYQLNFIVAFDSVLENTFNLRYLPYILIIDPNGIIRGITTSVDEKVFNELLAGGQPHLTKALTGSEWDRLKDSTKNQEWNFSDLRKDTSINSKEIFSSSLYHFDKESMKTKGPIDFRNPDLMSTKKALNSGILESVGTRQNSLFYIAYFGVSFWNANDTVYYKDYSKDFVFETKDSMNFIETKNTEYAYRLKVPIEKASFKNIKSFMQKDLATYFGYTGRMEKRLMPVYYLVILDSLKVNHLISQGNDSRFSYDTTLPQANQIVLNNSSIGNLCRLIGGFTGTQQPIIDGTGFTKKIDIDLRAYIYDLEAINTALQAYGLSIVKGLKELNTIVINDTL